MREIKFRYWDKKNSIFWDEPRELNDFVFNYGRNYSDAGNDEDRIVFAGQYTGLKDKNGKEIYEGDIVLQITYEGEIKANVSFYAGSFRAGRNLLNNTYFDSTLIIGNIYENPDLI